MLLHHNNGLCVWSPESFGLCHPVFLESYFFSRRLETYELVGYQLMCVQLYIAQPVSQTEDAWYVSEEAYVVLEKIEVIYIEKSLVF